MKKCTICGYDCIDENDKYFGIIVKGKEIQVCTKECQEEVMRYGYDDPQKESK